MNVCIKNTASFTIGTPPMRLLTGLLLLAALTAGCEKSVDPQTGERTLRFTLPGTSAKETAWQERWQRCTQFRSESFCERSVPGGRPPGTGNSQSVEENTPGQRQDDP
jgi:hypothetical protein